MDLDERSYHALAGLQRRHRGLGLALVWVLRVYYGLPAIVISGRRTRAEQAHLVNTGASLTMNSKHLQGRAFDIWFQGFDAEQIPDEWWYLAGLVGEWLGLTWGGRWTRIRDLGHFEK